MKITSQDTIDLVADAVVLIAHGKWQWSESFDPADFDRELIMQQLTELAGDLRIVVDFESAGR